jgi:superfamily II DNA helicase RecQ
MHSYADRYTHDFFFERDYPDVAVLDALFAKLRPEPMEKSALRGQMRVDSDLFDKAFEKLWIYGGAVVDYAENVSAGQGHWREAYIAQGKQKRAQIEQMIRFAGANQCRMSALVRHFGDLADAHTDCGVCDFCAPSDCAAQAFRPATAAERAAAFRVLEALHAGERKSTGRLHAELFPAGEMSRDDFENTLGAMARAGLAQLSDEVFEKDGRQIPYRKVSLSPAGRAADETTAVELILKEAAAPPVPRKHKPSRAQGAPRKRAVPREHPKPVAAKAPAPDSGVEEALRAWRLREARRLGVPAFRVFSDQALRAIAQQRPATAAELLAIPGIGMSAVEKYGRQIYRLLGKE